MTKRTLVIGVTGRNGLCLSALLLARGYGVYGLVRGQDKAKLSVLGRSRHPARSPRGGLDRAGRAAEHRARQPRCPT